MARAFFVTIQFSITAILKLIGSRPRMMLRDSQGNEEKVL